MDGIQALRDLKGIEVVSHSDDNYGTKNRYRWISVYYSLGGRQAYKFVYLGKDMLETYPGSLKSKYTTFGSHLEKRTWVITWYLEKPTFSWIFQMGGQKRGYPRNIGLKLYG